MMPSITLTRHHIEAAKFIMLLEKQKDPEEMLEYVSETKYSWFNWFPKQYMRVKPEYNMIYRDIIKIGSGYTPIYSETGLAIKNIAMWEEGEYTPLDENECKAIQVFIQSVDEAKFL